MHRGSVLCIVHQRHSYPGRLGRLFMERGFFLDVRCPQLGQALPETPDAYATTLMFGGPMSANDEHLPGIATELRWLERTLDCETPFIGVCLGAQILARVLGAEVSLHPEGHVEIGYSPLTPTQAGCDYFPDEISGPEPAPMQVFQWHKEGFEAPSGTVALAKGNAAFENQFFRYGKAAYGIQFHPEVTIQMLKRWTIGGAHMLDRPGAMPRDQQIAQHAVHDPALDDWSHKFVDHIIARAEDCGACEKRATAA